MVDTRSDADPEVHAKVQWMAIAAVVLTVISGLLLFGSWPWVTVAVATVALVVAMVGQLMSTTTYQRFAVIITAVAAGGVFMYELQNVL